MHRQITVYTVCILAVFLSGCSEQLAEWVRTGRGSPSQSVGVTSGVAYLRVSPGAQISSTADKTIHAHLSVGPFEVRGYSQDISAKMTLNSVRTEEVK